MEKKTFQLSEINRQSNLAFLSLFLLLVCIVGFSFFINNRLITMEKYSAIINESGKQRMRCQKLFKNLLIIADEETRGDVRNINELKTTIKNFIDVHQSIKSNDNNEIFGVSYTEELKTLLQVIETDVETIRIPITNLLNTFQDNKVFSEAEIDVAINSMSFVEGKFISKMNTIVLSFQRESEKVNSIIYYSVIVMFFIVMIILSIQYFLIFSPLFKNMRRFLKLHEQQTQEIEERNKKILSKIDDFHTTEILENKNDEYAFSIIENREQERLKVARQLDSVLLRKLLITRNYTRNVDKSDIRFLKERIDKISDILLEIEQEVKRLTYNLRPSDIMEFGMISAAAKYCEFISKLSKIQIEFNNETFFYHRFDHIIEVNLYRVIQESIEVLILSEATGNYTLTLMHDDDFLSIELLAEKTSLDQVFTKKSSIDSTVFQMIEERASLINTTFDYGFTADVLVYFKILFPLGVDLKA